MADVQNVITLGIGSAPGSLKFLVLLGLDANPSGIVGGVDLTLNARALGLTLDGRGALTLETRSLDLTAETR